MKIKVMLIGILILGCSFFKPRVINPINIGLIDTTYNAGKMYYFIEKYSEEMDIPKYILYNIAFKESSYQGPLDSTYKHNLISKCGALGPFQIIPSTANFIMGNKIPKDQLKNDIETNIKVSARLLTYLHKRYKRWEQVVGAYNTGKPIENAYSRYVVNNLDYKNKWKNF